MPNILANSKKELNQIVDLLNKDIPSYRQAYSDRTAWIMSCMSELAYIRFNPLFSSTKQKDYFIDSISKLVDKNSKSSLVKLIDVVGYDHGKQRKVLEHELGTLRMKLIDTFDQGGTQAILVSFGNLIILAFRGTEATSIKETVMAANKKGTSAILTTRPPLAVINPVINKPMNISGAEALNRVILPVEFSD